MRPRAPGVNGIEFDSVFCSESLIDRDPERSVRTRERRVDNFKSLRIRGRKGCRYEELKNQERPGAKFSQHAASFKMKSQVINAT
jgi:hypothetical protein